MSKDEIKLKWQQAPVKTQWGDDMVVASVAIDKDHTVCLYCERDQTPKVDAMFALAEQPAQQEYTSFAEWANDYVRANLHKLKPAQQEPVAWMQEMPTQEGETRSVRMTTLKDHATLKWGDPIPLYTAPPQRPRVVFPTMLRKMWSGSEVQAWLDETVNKENT